MIGPLSTTTLLGASGMNSFPDNFRGAYREVALSALVAAEQVPSQLPGGRVLFGASQVFVETLADQLGLGDSPRSRKRGELSCQPVVEPQRDCHVFPCNTV